MNGQKLSIITFSIFYGFAGIMHFITPETYIEVIPSWLGNTSLLNATAGAVEILIAGLALFNATRRWAGMIAIVMLCAFIISHVYFIQIGSCAGDVCIAPWISWVRLILIHPLLIYWAFRISKSQRKII